MFDESVLRAATEGNASELKDLIRRGGNPRASNRQGTAIGAAVFAKSADAVRVLLQADPTLVRATYKAANGVGGPILVAAVSTKQPAIVEQLLNAGADPNWADAEGRSVLSVAAAAGEPATVRLLLKAGSDPNRRDDYGTAALAVAATFGNVDAARELLESGARPYPMDCHLRGQTALGYAKRDVRDPEVANNMVSLLLAHGARSDGRNRPIDEAYVDAVRRGDEAAVVAALANGADINACGRPPSDNVPTLAVNNPKLLGYLLDHGANINAINEFGLNALHSAAGIGNIDTIKLLVGRGMDVNRAGRYGQTPLVVAVQANRPRAVELLLKLGADPNARAPGGGDLVIFARRKGSSTLIAPMLENARGSETVNGPAKS